MEKRIFLPTDLRMRMKAGNMERKNYVYATRKKKR